MFSPQGLPGRPNRHWSAQVRAAWLALALLVFGLAGAGSATAVGPAPDAPSASSAQDPTPESAPSDPAEPPQTASEAPRADFVVLCEGFTCTMDASASVDPDGGIIETFLWEVADGSQGEGMFWGHTFTAPGVYTVRLTVIDDSGAAGVLEQSVKFDGPTESNPPPPSETAGSPPTTGGAVPGPTGSETGGPSETGTPEPTATEPSDSEAPPPSTPGVDPTVTEPPGSDTQEILDKCFEGTLVFRPPSPMVQGETKAFPIRVAFKDSPVDPAEELPGEGPIETESPKLCEFMRADLTSDGLDIELTSGNTGLIALPSEGVGMWSWNITAREAGTKQMVLTIWTKGPDGADVLVKTFEKSIEVKIGIGYVLGNAVKEWGEPLGITIPVVVGAIGALYLWWRRRRYQPKHAGSGNPPDPREPRAPPRFRRRRA
ncbi:PKD domain-containing protein [Arthrobacter sp. VKM Ac-2550]|uniref:PKD domain-containing protein n=1 Tax=Crystallibacter permensis TaxID=1938888 RepID=UPI00222736E7|nr:PKD domain-containing protein [Arthrobacter sp. VKM Ac-2550]MCW2131608.1 PKD domain-containing protein [Arthrobacter sp. VKM Ac-2550]